MSNPTPQKSNLNSASTKKMGQVSMQIAELKGATATRVTIQPGGSWSKDLKEAAGTSSCQKSHIGVVLSGKLAIKMDDGSEETFSESDFFTVPPGHDAWCDGDEPTVFVEISTASD